MLYREIITVCSQMHTKHTSTVRGQNVEIVNVTPSGTQNDHWNLFPNCCDLSSTSVTSIFQNVFSLSHNFICCVLLTLWSIKLVWIIYIYIYVCVCVCVCGPCSSVGIAADYGLDDPGSNPREDEIFRPSRPADPGAHPASCKMGTGSFPGVKCGRGVLLTTHPLLVPRSWKSRAILLPTLWATPGL